MNNVKKLLYSVYSPTKWEITLFRGCEETIDNLLDGFQLLGLDSDRNYFPQEVIDFINREKKHSFSAYNKKNNYLRIKVWRDDKWVIIFNWPIEKFNPEVILPHRHLVKELWLGKD